MFLRIGKNQMVNKNLLFICNKYKSSVLIVFKPVKTGFFDYSKITGVLYKFKNNQECDAGFESLVNKDYLLEYQSETFLKDRELLPYLDPYNKIEI